MKRQGIRTISQKVITKKEMASKVDSISLYILYLCLLSFGELKRLIVRRLMHACQLCVSYLQIHTTPPTTLLHKFLLN